MAQIRLRYSKTTRLQGSRSRDHALLYTAAISGRRRSLHLLSSASVTPHETSRHHPSRLRQSLHGIPSFLQPRFVRPDQHLQLLRVSQHNVRGELVLPPVSLSRMAISTKRQVHLCERRGQILPNLKIVDTLEVLTSRAAIPSRLSRCNALVLHSSIPPMLAFTHRLLFAWRRASPSKLISLADLSTLLRVSRKLLRLDREDRPFQDLPYMQLW